MSVSSLDAVNSQVSGLIPLTSSDYISQYIFSLQLVMSSSVPLTVPTVSSSPTTSVTTGVLTASELVTLTKSIETLITGKSLVTILTQLPTACVTLYQQVVLLYASSPANQQALVVQLLESVISSSSGLSATDMQVIDQLLSSLVPALLAYLPQIEEGVVTGFTEVEKEATGCLAWCKSKCC